MWRDQKLQTFYKKTGGKYFRVKVDMVRSRLKSGLESILKKTREVDEDRVKWNDVVEKNEGKGENSPWLVRTNWKRTFVGKDMKSLTSYLNINDGLEPELIEVKKSVERLIDSCIASVEDLDSRGWNEIRFWLRSHQEGRPHEKPLRKPATELNKYKKVWTRLIIFCWRTFELEEVGGEFLDCQRDGIRQLRDAVCLQSADDRIVDELMLKLSVCLIKHSDFEREGSVIKYVAGIMGYKVREGRWKRPDHYTPTLAAIQFCIRVILLEDSLPMRSRGHYRHGSGETPLESFRREHSKWLVDGGGTPYSWVHKLMNYGMTIAKDAKGEDRVRFSADRKYCYFDGHGFKVEEWKSMVKDIVRRLEKHLSRELLFRQKDTIDPINPYSFVDHEYVHEVGHYFAYLLPDHRHAARKSVLESLSESSQDWDKMVRTDGTFEPDGVATYRKSVIEFLELLLLAINWTCGQTGRGTEMVSLLYRNKMSADRNIFVQDGQIMVGTDYHKSQAVMDDVKV